MKNTRPPETDEGRQEYQRADFDEMTRGKYAEQMAAASNVVVIDPDVSKVFPNAQAVNDALRALIDIAKASANATRSIRQHYAKSDTPDRR
jgi:hypothetical protein